MNNNVIVPERLVKQTVIPHTGEEVWRFEPQLVTSWGDEDWVSFDWMNSRLNRICYRLGHRDLKARYVVQCETFYPFVDKAGPHFIWVAVIDSRTHLCEGDIMYCPFPNTPPVRDRLELGLRGQLFLPLSWVQALTYVVEKFAATQIGCQTKGVPCNQYTVRRLDGQVFDLEYEEVLALCPPLARATPTLVAA